MSWKRWTFEPRVTQAVWTDTDGWDVARQPENPPRQIALRDVLWVGACEVAALRIHDRVLTEGPVVDRDYAARRHDNVIVAVECAARGVVCVCTSMGTGPELAEGFDLSLSELDDVFVIRVGSPAGWSVVEDLPI